MAPLTPLLRPDRYFAERESRPAVVLTVVVLVVIGALAVFYGMGWIFADRIDGTVTVDNPERPADWVCEDNSPPGTFSGCEEPRRVQRNVDPLLWNVWHDGAGQLFFGIFGGWLLFGAGLHLGSWFAVGKDEFFASFAVAAWGLVPLLVGFIALFPVIYFTFDPITVTAANQETVIESAMEQLQLFRSLRPIVVIGTTFWTAVIWRYGLEQRRGLSPTAAWLVAGLVASIFGVVSLT